jgi:hypothetical protein
MACSSPAKVFAEEHTGSTMVARTPLEDDKKPSKKSRSARKTANAVSVRVVPDIFKRAMHLVTRSENEKEMNVFVFDIEGKLVFNCKTKAGERKTISDLPKGSYTYNVFCDDEQVATGTLQFR